MDADTKEYRLVSSFQGNIRNPVWAPNSKSLLFTGEVKTTSNLFKVAVGTGEVKQLTNQSASIAVSSFSRDRTKMVYSFSDHYTSPDIYSSSTSNLDPIRLTNANSWIEKEISLAEAKRIKWKSRYGLEIEGLLHLPADYQEGRKLPLILHVHGGPSGHFANRFSARNQIWAGLGYAQLSPNFRGSGAYGDEFHRANMYDIGGGEYEDLMTGVDYVIEEGYADSERMGIRGWSWGGVLGGWTITHTTRFKAASLGAMVTDWIAEYANGFGHNIVRWLIGGHYWENPDGWRTRSSLTYIRDVTTPTIVFHGEKDTTCSPPQSMTFSVALKDQGVPVRYILFPREPHGLREPRHQRTRDIEEIKWMQKYVLGLEWSPWERDEKK